MTTQINEKNGVMSWHIKEPVVWKMMTFIYIQTWVLNTGDPF